jgi:hypothetical protein
VAQLARVLAGPPGRGRVLTSAAIKSQSVDVATQSTLILFVPLP